MSHSCRKTIQTGNRIFVLMNACKDPSGEVSRCVFNSSVVDQTGDKCTYPSNPPTAWFQGNCGQALLIQSQNWEIATAILQPNRMRYSVRGRWWEGRLIFMSVRRRQMKMDIKWWMNRWNIDTILEILYLPISYQGLDTPRCYSLYAELCM